MRDQRMEGFSGGWLHNRGEPAINGWDISRWDGISGKGYQWFFGEISLGKEVWMRVRGMGCFPLRMFSNGGFQQPVGQPGSLTLTGYLRRCEKICLLEQYQGKKEF